MKTEAQEISERIERVLSSEQWKAIKESFASRMDVASTTSLSMKENLKQGELTFMFNFEKREDGVHLITYQGRFVPEGKQEINGENRSTIERLFNAEGKYVFSFREAINLLQGRAILKSYVAMDGSPKEGWFKAVDKLVSNEFLFYFSGRQAILPKYDLEDIVARLPMSSISVGQKVELIRSLQSGDLQSVNLQLNGKEVSGYIQAAPESKGISLFDDQMKSLDIGQFVRKEEKKLRSQRNIGLSMGE